MSLDDSLGWGGGGGVVVKALIDPCNFLVSFVPYSDVS